jgi:PHD/YefM family antitoxin component YafN of YafNO toxin-antitoxin module
MRTVTAGTFQKMFGLYGDVATHEPVNITKYGRDQWVIMSRREFDELDLRRRIVSSAVDVDEATHSAILRKDDIPDDGGEFDHELD